MVSSQCLSIPPYSQTWANRCGEKLPNLIEDLLWSQNNLNLTLARILHAPRGVNKANARNQNKAPHELLISTASVGVCECKLQQSRSNYVQVLMKAEIARERSEWDKNDYRRQCLLPVPSCVWRCVLVWVRSKISCPQLFVASAKIWLAPLAAGVECADPVRGHAPLFTPQRAGATPWSIALFHARCSPSARRVHLTLISLAIIIIIVDRERFKSAARLQVLRFCVNIACSLFFLALRNSLFFLFTPLHVQTHVGRKVLREDVSSGEIRYIRGDIFLCASERWSVLGICLKAAAGLLGWAYFGRIYIQFTNRTSDFNPILDIIVRVAKAAPI